MTKHSRSFKGFTLLEVLAVISVMMILAGILLPSLRTARSQAFEAKTKAQLSSLSLALKMYRSDIGQYPAELGDTLPFEPFLSKDGLNAAAQLRWRGPYLELKDRDKGSTGAVVDAWGHPFQYHIYATPHDGRDFELKSLGRNQNGTDDDIDYWTM